MQLMMKTIKGSDRLLKLSVACPGSPFLLDRLAPAAGFRRSVSGFYGRALRQQPRGDLRGHEAGAGCPSHPQHLQDHRVPPHDHKQRSEVRNPPEFLISVFVFVYD